MTRLRLAVSLMMLSASLSVWSGCSGTDESPTPSSPTPIATPTPATTPVVTPTSTPVATPTATPVVTPTPTGTPSGSPTPTSTPGTTPTATPGTTPTATPGTTPTPTPGVTPTPTPGVTPTPTMAPTATPNPDADEDGYSPADGDCNDNDAAIYPGAPEIVDGKDNNCDGKIDDKPDTIDNDKDGFSEAQGDCDDTDKTIFPGGTEIPYDGIDQDCSGADLIDVDGDGFGSVETGNPADTDCDDDDKDVNPDATEICNDIDDNCDDQIDEGLKTTWYRDQDGDTYGNAANSVTTCTPPGAGYVLNKTDCDDASASVNPGAQEVCDSKDNDCDSKVDDADDSVTGKPTWYKDGDTDGYGTSGTSTQSCSQPSGYVTSSTDCNDADKAINPGAQEVCDSKDNDCDTKIDDADDSVTGQNTFYKDADTDGYGSSASPTQSCSLPSGYVTSSTDCNDADKAINPGAQEICDSKDNDCDTKVDDADDSVTGKSTWYKDTDTDGYGSSVSSVQACTQPTGYVSNKDDCNDADKTINPLAQEVCDSKDNDCDNKIDDADDSVTGKNTFYQDADTDGYGSSSVSTQACTKPSGYVTSSTDCNDADKAINPGAQEVCDSKDNDCDAKIDDADDSTTGKTTWYKDTDNDGYGVTATTTTACTQPTGYVSQSGDCNDSDKLIYPTAPELCNGKDDNCNGSIDDGVTNQTWYKDADGDTYGNPSVTTSACSQPSTYVSNKTDCDDTNAAINPAAQEVCDSKDNDCDTLIDDADSSTTGKNTFYQDADTDGYGSATVTTQACVKPTGYVTSNTDCNDADKAINPAAQEVCNAKDDDCDTKIDDADSSVTGRPTWYKDTDNDGYGTTATTTTACTQPSGYVSQSGDCNDADATIKPGATEQCNGKDDNCNGTVDDGVTNQTWYKDADGDTYGNPSLTTSACSQPATYVSNKTDCDDTNAAINPAAQEVCDSKDNDCDALVDDSDPSTTGKNTFYKDADGDNYGSSSVTTQACVKPTGFVTSSTDCNDANASINPGASEVCDQVDNNCNGTTDEGLPTVMYYKDVDNDGYGSPTNTTMACAKPTGYVTNSTDCNDANPSVNPAANETCNGVDDNCNGSLDENSAATCPGTDGACAVRSCSNGTCGFQNKPQGTEVSDTTAGDCKSEQCDGSGNVAPGPKDSDKPNDNNSCTTDACSSGTPAYTSVAEGAACTDNGGTTCDGAGTCTLSYVVLQVGDGVTALASTATQVALEERFINGNKVNRVGNPMSIPATSSAPNNALTLGGTATSEGELSRSEDGHYLVFGGYNAAVGGTAGSSTVARTLARVDNTGTLDTTTQVTPAFSAATMRGTTSANGSGFWATSSTGGVHYVTLGSTGASTQVLAAPTNMRWVSASNGQLYGSSGSGTYVNVFQIGAGQPTTTGATATSFAGMPTTTGPSPYGFMLFDLNSSVAGVDTLYVADDTNPTTSVGGVQKWTNNGTTWTKVTTFKNGLGTIGVRGLTATVYNGKVYVIATTADATSASNKVVMFIDDGVNLDPAATVIATSPAKTQFRGVALPPR